MSRAPFEDQLPPDLLAAEAKRRTPIVTYLSDVVPEDVSWLWPGRVPFGKVTVLEGDPGLGKSTLLLDLAARLSVGGQTADGHQMEAAGTVILTAEDGLADTVRPRVDAAGGDPSRILALEAVLDLENGKAPIELPAHVDAVEKAIKEVDARLVLVDPLVAFIGSGVNTWRDHDIRRALRPLVDLAERTKAAIVFIRHLTKGLGPAIYRGGGSIGIVGAVRSALLVARDPGDEERLVLALVKANLARDPGSLSFYVEDDGYGRARIRWAGRSELRANALVSLPPDSEQQSETDEAADWLRHELEEGPRPAKEVGRLARQAGLGEKAVRRARERIGVKPRRIGFGSGGEWVWALPIDAPIDALGALNPNGGNKGAYGASMETPEEAERLALEGGA